MSVPSGSMRNDDVPGDLTDLLDELAAVARRTLADAVPDPNATRDVGRRLGLSTTNAWRFVRLAREGATAQAVESMPGLRGGETMLAALAKSGADREAIASMRGLVERLFRELERRGLHRTDLPRFATRQTSVRAAAASVAARETRTNALLWGAAATGMATTYLVRIEPRHRVLEVVGLSTFAGLRRLRPGPEWWLPTPNRVLDADRRTLPLSLDPRLAFDVSALLSKDARLELGRSPEGHIAFRGGPRTAMRPIDLASTFVGAATADARVGSEGVPAIFAAPIWIPVSEFVLEVLFERSLAPTSEPQVRIYAQIGSDSVATEDRDHFIMPGSGRSSGLSMTPRCEELAPPFSRTSSSGRELHAAALAGAIGSMGLEAGDFVRHRLVVAHPVLCTSVELAWPSA